MNHEIGMLFKWPCSPAITTRAYIAATFSSLTTPALDLSANLTAGEAFFRGLYESTVLSQALKLV